MGLTDQMMKVPDLKAIAILLFLLGSKWGAYGQPPQVRWVEKLEARYQFDEMKLAPGPGNSVYVVEQSRECCHLNVSHFDQEGKLLWREEKELPVDTRITHCLSDAAGNLVLAGNYSRSLDFFGVELPRASVTFGANSDFFVGKISSEGAGIWVNGFGGEWKDFIMDLKVAPNGDLMALATYASKVIDFEEFRLTRPVPFDNNWRQGNMLALIRFTTDGNVRWARKFGSDRSNVDGTPLAVDATGNIYFGIYSYFGDYPELNIEQAPDPSELSSAYLVSLNQAGEFRWKRDLGTTLDFICSNWNGKLMIGGQGWRKDHFRTPWLFSHEGYNLDDAGMYLAVLNTGGKLEWAVGYGLQEPTGPGCQLASIRRDHEGHFLIAGRFGSSLQLGGFFLTSEGENEVFAGRLSPDGDFSWAMSVGGKGDDRGNDLVEGRQPGCYYLVGQFDSPEVYCGTVPVRFQAGALSKALICQLMPLRFNQKSTEPGGGSGAAGPEEESQNEEE